MVFKLFIDKSRAEEVTATVHERTALIDEIERLVLQESITDKIPGYEDDTIVMLPTDSVECFYVENDKTYAHCADKRRYLVKKAGKTAAGELRENKQIGHSELEPGIQAEGRAFRSC